MLKYYVDDAWSISITFYKSYTGILKRQEYCVQM